MGMRQEKLADEIRDILGRTFSGQQLNDPRVQGVTITHVKISPDLQIASVYFRTFNPEDTKDAQTGLQSSKGFLKKRIASAIKARHVPDLRFFYDDSIDQGSHIEKLLAKSRET